MRRKRKYKIGEMKPRCTICGQRVSNYIQDQHDHIMRFHIVDLQERGVPTHELELFKKGFTWERSTSNPPL